MNPTIETLAETEQLGNLLEGFGRCKGWMCWLLKLCILCFPFAVCFALSIIGIPVIIADFYFMYWSIKGMRAGKILFLYDYGLIDRINSEPQVIRYENITKFWKSITKIYQNGSYQNTRSVYTIQIKEGKKRKYWFMEDPEDL